MSALLASDSETEGELKININKDYANKYDTWRRKEEFQKLKDRYGEVAASRLDDVGGVDSSSEEEEDENADKWTEENERDFLKTLSYLKKKDPAIYDNNVRFFKDQEQGTEVKDSLTKKKKEKPLLYRDYKSQLLLKESSFVSSDDEEGTGSDTERQKLNASPTLVEEERAIKESFTSALKDSEDESEGWGGLFQKRNKTQQELDKENEDYREWLKGQREQLGDEKVESELKPLREFWNDPKLDEGEKFLRDYILNKRFMEDDDKDRVPTYDEIVHDSDEDLSADEQTLEQQEVFEHKFNFRFEEPDTDFVRRYPRLVENTMRKKDDRRKVKRAEGREKKRLEKLRKLEEVKQLKALKRKELQERIQKLKEITGNAELGFKDEDIDGDFDPSEYDQRMKQLFDDEFYREEEDTQKPEFPDLDEELELENWDQWDGSKIEQNDDETWNDEDIHCEDPNFNMDCDYDPKTKLQQEMVQSTRRRKRKRQSKLAQALAVKKPMFDPNEKSFEDYVEQYYSLDFEDVIGDLPCRFKYRKVVPNSFGLTVEEILKADDKELNSWCSLRKAVQYRPDTQELFDVKAYQAKSKKEYLKKKYLKSLFIETKDEDSHEAKTNKGIVKRQHDLSGEEKDSGKVKEFDDCDLETNHDHVRNAKESINIQSEYVNSSIKANKKNTSCETLRYNINGIEVSKSSSKKCKRNKRKATNAEADFVPSNTPDVNCTQNYVGKHFVPKKKSKYTPNSQGIGISDTRLRAYGIRPKKFKNKLRYGKQFK